MTSVEPFHCVQAMGEIHPRSFLFRMYTKGDYICDWYVHKWFLLRDFRVLFSCSKYNV